MTIKKSSRGATTKSEENPSLAQRLTRLAELELAIENERAEIAKQREADLRMLWKTFVDHVESAGSSVEEVMRLGGFKKRRSSPTKPAGPSSASKQKVQAVYVNPADPSQTWSGRGRQARWLTEALAADPKKLLTDFLTPQRTQKSG